MCMLALIAEDDRKSIYLFHFVRLHGDTHSWQRSGVSICLRGNSYDVRQCQLALRRKFNATKGHNELRANIQISADDIGNDSEENKGAKQTWRESKACQSKASIEA